MRFDRASLVLLNLLAITRLLPVGPAVIEAVAIVFLIRVTMAMSDTSLVTEGRHPSLAARS